MGFVDRGGGREAKGSSLRRSTKNPGAAAARQARAVKAAPVPAGPSPPPPPLARTDESLSVDFGVALLSRSLDPSREGLWDRALEEGRCAAAVVWSSEIAKQQELLQAANDKAGIVYAAVGIHPDNVDRTNKRAQDTWLESLESLGRNPSCVAFISGLNLQRDHATHYFQEQLLQATAALAVKLELPLFLHVASDAETIERVVALLAPMIASQQLIAVVHNIISVCGRSAQSGQLLAQAGFYATVSAAGLSPEELCELGDVARDVLAAFGDGRLLLSSNSPWNTPQNMPDEHMRSLANEPCNLPYVIDAIVAALVPQPPPHAAEPQPEDTAADTEDVAAAADHAAWLKQFAARRETLLVSLRHNALKVLGFGREPRAATAAELAAARAAAGSDDDSDGESDDHEEDTAPSAPSAPSAKPRAAGRDAGVREDTTPSHPADVSSDALRPQPIPGAKATNVYSCVKCRADLFNQLALVTHPVGARTAVFEKSKGGSSAKPGGSCAAALFVDLSDAQSGAEDRHGTMRVQSAPGLTFALNSADVLCATCKCKIGSAQKEAACPCGLVVPGLSARLVASRVDFTTTDATQDDVLARAAAEHALHQDEASESGDDDDKRGKAKEAKKNVKQQNRSNMSNFRNKNWTPGMAKVAEDVQAEQATKGGKGGKGARRKGQRRGDSSEDDA